MRESILKHASELFLTQGFKTTTMDDICQQMGISKKTLYQYFKDKKAIISECGKQFLQQAEEIMISLDRENVHPVLFVFVHGQRISNISNINPNQTSHSIFQLKKYYPEIHRKIAENHFHMIHKYFENNLKRGIEQGFFRSNLNTDFVSRLFFVISNEICCESPFLSPFYDPQSRQNGYKEYHIRAISTPLGVSVLEEYLNNI